MSDSGEVIISVTYDAGQSAQKVVDASNKIMNSADAVNKSLGGVSRTISSLASRLDPIGSLIEKLTKQYDQLRAAQEKLGQPNSFTPEMEASIKQGIALLPRLRQEIEGLQQSYVASATGVDKFNAEVERQNSLIAKSAAITQQVQIDQYNKKMTDSAKATKDAADRVEMLTNKYSQDVRASKAYAQTKSELNELMDKGKIGFGEYNVEMNRAIDIYNRSTVAGQKQAASQKQIKEETDKTTFAFGLNRIGMLELQAAGINTFQALASGMSPFRVATMESAQVVGAFIQGVDSAGARLLAFAGSTAGVVTIALTAVAAAFAVILTRTVSNESQLRRFDTAIGSVTPTLNTSSVGLQTLSYNLRAVGLSAADAEKSILSLTHNLNINQNNSSAIQSVANIGLNVGARLGIGDVAGIEKVNAAISGGADALVKLGLETRAFTVDEAAAIAIDAQHGNGIKAVNDALKLIDDRLAGEHKQSLSAAGEAANTLGGAYNKFLNSLSDTIPFKAVHDAIVELINQVSEFVKQLNSVPTALQAVYNATPIGFLNNAVSNLATGIGQRFSGQISGALGISPLRSGGALAPIPTAASDQARFAANSDLQWLSQNMTIPTRDHPGGMPITWTGGTPPPFDMSFRGQKPATVPSLFNSNDFTPNGVQLGTTPFIPTSRFSPLLNPNSSSGFRTGLANQITPASTVGVGGIAQQSTIDLEKQKTAVDELNRGYGDATKTAALWNITQQAQTSFTSKYDEVLKSTNDSTKAWDQANIEFNKTRDVGLINLGKQSFLQGIETKGINDSATAFRSSTSEGLKANAMYQAQLDHINTGADVNKRYTEILAQQAAEGVRGAAEQLAAQNPIIVGQQKLVEAAKQSSLAEHDVRIQNEANLATQKALDAEKAAGIIRSQGMVDALNKETQAQILAKEAAQNSLDTIHITNQARDTGTQLQLQVDMQGKTSAEIQKQLDILTEIQKINRETPNLTQSEVEQRLKAAAAVGDMRIKLEDAQKAESRFEDGIKSAADSITNDLGSAITNAFSGQKALDWGATVKKVIADLVSELAKTQLIKPLFGSIFSGLGLTNLGSQFGTLGGGSGGGGLSSLFGGSSSSNSNNSVTLSQNSNGTFSLNNVGSAISGIDKLSSLGSGTSFGLTDALSGLGGLITDGPATVFGTGIAEGGASFGVADALGGGLGLAAGLGSLIPIAGAVIGGIGLIGSLTGLFGGKPKTKNNFGYGALDAATGAINLGVASSSGNQQNDQATQQTLNSLSQFITSIGSILPKGTAFSQGGVEVATGTKSGTVATLTDPFGNNSMFGNTPQAALSGVELELAKRLTGMSATLKQVVDSVSDPAQLQTAIQFAATYDKLNESFKNNFSSISQDTKIVGQFETALNSINDTFTSLKTNAGLYGLSLDPVNAGLTEATKELHTSFRLFLNELSSGTNDFLTPLQAAHQSFVQNTNDAKALGENVGGQISDIEKIQIGAVAVNLSLSQLQKAQQVFASTAPEISAFIDTLIKSGSYLPDEITQMTQAITDPVGLAIEKEKFAGEQRVRIAQETGQNLVDIAKYNQLSLETIWKQATQGIVDLKASLVSGSLSGASPLVQFQALKQKYQMELGLVQGGNTAEISNLTSAAQNLVSTSITDFGQGKQTSGLRNSILNDLNSVLAKKGFAAGTDYLPPGYVMVGENGPEWVRTTGGGSVYPSGQKPQLGGNSAELISEVRMLRQTLENGHMIAKGVGVETVTRLDQIVTGQNKKSMSQMERQKV